MNPHQRNPAETTMTNRQKLGVVLAATPYVAAFFLAGFLIGWTGALIVFGSAVAAATLFVWGFCLLSGDE